MSHVFISHVHNNQRKVQRLCNALTKYGVKVWLDRNELKPGSRWQDTIEEAIQEGNFFLACFSKQYNEREESFMNQELAWAIERLARFSTDRTWFIPVKLNKCKVPNRRIGGGERLQDLQYVELYPEKKWDAGIKRIASVIRSDLSDRDMVVGLSDSVRLMDEFNREWRAVLTCLKLEVVNALHGNVNGNSLQTVSDEFISFATANEGMLNDDETARGVAVAFTGFASSDFPCLTPEDMAARLWRLSNSLDVAIAKTYGKNPVQTKTDQGDAGKSAVEPGAADDT